ncbi:MAG: hypothetical protein HW401_753 [Parcubacteria group bacterium]|nr:hypothetical protein [Parcubacteria group bacterium]
MNLKDFTASVILLIFSAERICGLPSFIVYGWRKRFYPPPRRMRRCSLSRNDYFRIEIADIIFFQQIPGKIGMNGGEK